MTTELNQAPLHRAHPREAVIDRRLIGFGRHTSNDQWGRWIVRVYGLTGLPVVITSSVARNKTLRRRHFAVIEKMEVAV